MGFLRKLIKKLRLLFLLPLVSFLVPFFRKRVGVKVKSVTATLDEMFLKRKSIIRFGDGELRLLMGTGETDFQKSNPILCKRLRELMRKIGKGGEDGSILLCMPGVLSECPREYVLKGPARLFWFTFLINNAKKLRGVFDLFPGYVFGDACLTRPYMDTQDLNYANQVFSRVKAELKGKNVLILEGRLSRFGVGNDLLSGAKSIRRILGPEKNAFDRYDVILDRARREKDVDVVILAMGPAAKILTYELSMLGFWCLDLGHLDVEYEWFKMKALTKTNINNKYVNESSKKFISNGEVDEDYKKQIVCMCG